MYDSCLVVGTVVAKVGPRPKAAAATPIATPKPATPTPTVASVSAGAAATTAPSSSSSSHGARVPMIRFRYGAGRRMPLFFLSHVAYIVHGSNNIE